MSRDLNFINDSISLWTADQARSFSNSGTISILDLNLGGSDVFSLGSVAELGLDANASADVDLYYDFNLDAGSASVNYTAQAGSGFIYKKSDELFIDANFLDLQQSSSVIDAPFLNFDVGFDVLLEAGFDIDLSILDVIDLELAALDQSFVFDDRVVLLKGEFDTAAPLEASLDSDFFDVGLELPDDPRIEFNGRLGSVALLPPSFPDGPPDFEISGNVGDLRYADLVDLFVGDPFIEASLDVDALVQSIAANASAPGTGIVDVLEGEFEVEIEDIVYGVDVTAAFDVAALDVELVADARIYQELTFDPTGLHIRSGNLAETINFGEVRQFSVGSFENDISVELLGQVNVETGLRLDFDLALDIGRLNSDITVSTLFRDFDFEIDTALYSEQLDLFDLEFPAFDTSFYEIALSGDEAFQVDALPVFKDSEATEINVAPEPVQIEPPVIAPPDNGGEIDQPGDRSGISGRFNSDNSSDAFDVDIQADTFFRLTFSNVDHPENVLLKFLTSDGNSVGVVYARDYRGEQLSFFRDVDTLVVERVTGGASNGFDTSYAVSIEAEEPSGGDLGGAVASIPRTGGLLEASAATLVSDFSSNRYEAPDVAPAFASGGANDVAFNLVYAGPGNDADVYNVAFNKDGENRRDVERVFSEDSPDDQTAPVVASNKNVPDRSIAVFISEDREGSHGLYFNRYDLSPELDSPIFRNQDLPLIYSDSGPSTSNLFATYGVQVGFGAARAIRSPDAAMFDDGSWAASYVANGEIFVHRMGADDLPVGDPRRVNLNDAALPDAVNDSDVGPKIAALSDGSAVIAWVGSNGGRYVTKLNSDGSKTSLKIADGASGLYSASIAELANGDIVLAYTDGEEVRARILSSDLVLIGEEIAVTNDVSLNDLLGMELDVSAFTSGSFIVAYSVQNRAVSNGVELSDDGILARIYSQEGVARTESFVVADSDSEDLRFPDIAALNDSQFVVAWLNEDGYPDHQVEARRFHLENSLPAGAEIAVEFAADLTATVPFEAIVDQSLDPDGDFLRLRGDPVFDADSLSLTLNTEGDWVLQAVDGFVGDSSVIFTLFDGFFDEKGAAAGLSTVALNVSVTEPLPEAPVSKAIISDGVDLGEGGQRVLGVDDFNFVNIEDPTSLEFSVVATDGLSLKNLPSASLAAPSLPLANLPSVSFAAQTDEQSFSFSDLAAGRVSLEHLGGEAEPTLLIQASNAEGVFDTTLGFDFQTENDSPTNIAISFSSIEEGATGALIGFASADDEETPNGLTFALFGMDAARLAIDPESGVLSLADDLRLAELEAPELSFSVRVEDADGGEAEESFTVTVEANPELPVFSNLPIDVNSIQTTDRSDQISLNDAGGEVQISGALDGKDNVVGGSGFDILLLDGSFTNLVIASDIERIVGGALADIVILSSDLVGSTVEGAVGDDILFGSNNNDRLLGGADNDQLRGLGGDDTLEGQGGNNTLLGGDGTDLAVFEATATDYTLSVDGGVLVVQSTSAGTIDRVAPDIERISFAGVEFDYQDIVDELGNQPPTTENAQIVVFEDSFVESQLLASDPDGDALTYALADDGGASNGLVAIDPDGSFTYTPDNDFAGEDAFTFTVSDGVADPVSQTVTITVTPVNDVPVPEALFETVTEDGVLNGQLAATDIDSASLTFALVGAGGPSNGSVTINADGFYTYTPDADFNGEDGFSFTVSDGEADPVLQTATITVTAVNDAPVPRTTTASTDEDAILEGQLIATDVDDEDLTFALADGGGASNGSVSINMDGSFTYTPDDGFNGEDTFTYSVSDDELAVVEETVTVTVNAVNDPPPPTVEAIVVAEDGSASGQFTTNLTNFLFFYPFDPFEAGGNRTANGRFDLNNDGSFQYRPNQDFSGTDDLEYILVDTDTFIDEMLTLSITVTAVNDAPVPQTTAAATDEDTDLNGQLLATDVDDENLTFALADGGGASNGSVSINMDGSFTYTPDDGFNGEDTFTYSVSDDELAVVEETVTVTVNAVNDAPLPTVEAIVVAEDEAVSGQLEATDVDSASLTFALAAAGGPANGSVTINSDGSYTYTPDEDFNGEDGFTFTVSDGEAEPVSQTATITVTAVNDMPTPQTTTASTDEDAVLDGQLVATDVDDEDLTFAIAGGGGASNGSVTIAPTGSFTYTPGDDFNGEDTFTYTVSDGEAPAVTATVNVTVNPVNDAPVAEDAADQGTEDTPITGQLAATDIDSVSLTFALEEGGGASNGSVTIGADGAFVYTPHDDFNGTDRFIYQVSDGSGGIDTATATLTVTAINDAPIAQTTSASTNEDTTLNGQLAASDVDGDDLTFALFDDENVASGALTLNADGSFTYTPNANFSGQGSFTYEVTDGNGGRDSQVLSITVNSVNDAPVFEDTTVEGAEDIVIDVALSADDIDGDDVAFTIALNGAPSNGTATITASQRLIYTPTANFFGLDTVTIIASDGNGGLTTATITLDIASVNDAPTADAISFEVDKGASFIGQLEGDDVESEALTFSLDPDFAPSEGDVTINADGSFTYAAGDALVGTDTFGFLVNDGQDGQASALASVKLNEPPSPDEGTNGADTFEGDRGPETFNGGGGNDTISGGGGGDSLAGGGGSDEIAGGGGKDFLQGNGGRDTLEGGGGKDTLEGGGGRDVLNGGGGRDLLEGGGGRDLLQGGRGRDTLDGGGGKDTMEGGNGRDDIIGGRGSDTLTGDGGNDRFIFDRGNGRDTITDFQQNSDKIVVEGGVDSFDDLVISQVGDDVLIRIANTRVTVEEDLVDNFTASDFIF